MIFKRVWYRQYKAPNTGDYEVTRKEVVYSGWFRLGIIPLYIAQASVKYRP